MVKNILILFEEFRFWRLLFVGYFVFFIIERNLFWNLVDVKVLVEILMGLL